MIGLFGTSVEEHIGKENKLRKLEELIDWNRIRIVLKDVHGELGRGGYDVVMMFKCLLLQSWHSLSDKGLEEAIRVRLDFLQFTGLSVGDKLPDHTTFCRFRNKLVEQGKYEVLLSEINRQLEEHEIKVKNADTAIVDATIISSAARPSKSIEVDENNNEITTTYSADSDAKWKKKGKKYHFGYQTFARCDKEGFIDKTHTTPANEGETKYLDVITNGLPKNCRVHADKGFFSAKNKNMLKQKGLKSGIMYKAFRNKPLDKNMKSFNKLISKNRFRIEQSFGTIKRRFSFHRASYFSTHKVSAQFTLKAICLNLLKDTNKVHLCS